LADRWGEPDPSKIAALPADTLFHWRAFFLKQGIFQKPGEEATDNLPPKPAQNFDDQCAAVMRAIM